MRAQLIMSRIGPPSPTASGAGHDRTLFFSHPHHIATILRQFASLPRYPLAYKRPEPLLPSLRVRDR